MILPSATFGPFMRRLVLSSLILLSPLAASAAAYVPQGRCEGWPRLVLNSPPGTCVALVASQADGLRFPRRLLEVAPGRFWIVDMGSWEPKRGRLLEMSLPAEPGARPAIKVLADGLDRPHGLVRGPDGKVYVGEAGAIWRTPVSTALQREVVLDKLPDDGAHPLKEMAFGDDGMLYVNVGSFSDACRNDTQAQPAPCPELQGAAPRAAIYQVTLGGGAVVVKPFASGLRNSLALAWLPGVGLLEAENAIDYSDAQLPPEKLNLVREGRHYGWPYCIGQGVAARGYEGRFDCKTSQPPMALWPAHAAPLAMLAPSNGPLKGQVLAAWHGYRPVGRRIVSFTVDAKGHASAPRDLIGDWSAKPGVRPMGTPAGLTVDGQGRLWIVEDRNRSVLMLGREDKP